MYKSYVLIYSCLICAIIGNSVGGSNLPAHENGEPGFDSREDVRAQITWLQQLKLLRSGIKTCETQSKASTWECFKINSLRIFDSVMKAPTISIWDGVRFVRAAHNDDVNDVSTDATGAGVDGSGGVGSVGGDGGDGVSWYTRRRHLTVAASGVETDDAYLRQDMAHQTWFDCLAIRLSAMLMTHNLQINLKDLTNAYLRAMDRRANRTELHQNDPVGTGRLRRHRYNMIITMMFGVTALGAILVPIGFQVLSVVSGKALLLAKMALLLASINGLKRVANSGVHYGLYHVPGEHYGGIYDRGDVHHPRNVPGLAIAHPIEDPIGIRK